MSDNVNPLAGHFRQPKLYMKLPSGGKFNSKEDLDIPETGEIAVYPMTAKDELLMKNPDALLNGDAINKVITSCVPNVKNAFELVNMDIDALLLGIRSATNGDEIDVDESCPECEHKIEGTTSLQGALDEIEPVKELTTVKVGDLSITLKPVKYIKTVEAGIENFKTTRSLQSIADLPDDMDKLKVFNENFEKLAFMNFSLLLETIKSITINGDEVTVVEDRDQIAEFLNNCEASIGQKITEAGTKITSKGISKTIPFECEECGHTFEKDLLLDPVNFFTAS